VDGRTYVVKRESRISDGPEQVLRDCIFPNVMAGKETHSPHLLTVAAMYGHSWLGQRRVTVQACPNLRWDLA
jgi:hypothetical protein